MAADACDIRIVAIARPRQHDIDRLAHAARPRRHRIDAVGKHHRLVDVVRHEEDGLPRLRPSRSTSRCIRRRVSASSAPKGSSISSTSGSTASARAISSRCRIAPRELGGVVAGEVLELRQRQERRHRRVQVAVAAPVRAQLQPISNVRRDGDQRKSAGCSNTIIARARVRVSARRRTARARRGARDTPPPSPAACSCHSTRAR